MSSPLLITADEINCLIFAYLNDSGFQHSAFAIRTEGRLEQSSHFSKHIPRGELVELLSKALLYVEVETHWKGDAMTTNCKSGFSLLEPHNCSAEPKAKSKPTPQPKSNANVQKQEQDLTSKTNVDFGTKRKADSPTNEDGHTEKRLRRTPEDMDVDSVVEIEPIKSKSTDSKSLVAAPSQASNSISTLDKKSPVKASPAKHLTYPPDAVRLWHGHKSEVFVSAWNPLATSLLATGSKDGIVNVWNLSPTSPPGPDYRPLKLAYFAKPDQGDLTSLDWNFDGSLLAIGSYDSILRVCTAAGKLFFSHRQHEGPIFAAKFSKNGQWLLTASLDGTACVWNVKFKKLHNQYKAHSDCCLDLDWINDTTFATCGADMMIYIMRLDEQTPLKTLTGHSNEINQIKVNPSATRLASCADDQTARIWNISDLSNTGSPDVDAIPGLSETDRVVLLEGHEHSVSSVGWCPRSSSSGGAELIATASFDCTARLWDSMTGECLKVFSEHTRPVYALTFSPDGTLLGSGGGDGWLNIYSSKTKEKLFSWYAGATKPGVFEISWQQTASTNRIALALERHQVAVLDLKKIPVLANIENL